MQGLVSWRGVTLFFHRVTFTLLPPHSGVNGTEEIWTPCPKALLSSPKFISKDSNRKGKLCNVQINRFDSKKKKRLLETQVPVIAFFFQTWFSSKWIENNSNIQASVFFQNEGRESDDFGGYSYSVLLFYFSVLLMLRAKIRGIFLLVKDSK